MSYRHYLGGFLCGCIVLIAVCVAAFFLTAGYQAKRASVGWAPTLIKAKTEAVMETASPKAVIIAGSNGLFGVDARQLSKLLAIPVYNAACFGALTWPYVEHYAFRHLKAGDYAILPLEMAYYDRTDTLNTETVLTAHSVGLGYFRSLSLQDKLSYLRLIDLKFVRQQMQDRFLPLNTKRTFKYFGYTLQPSGDIDLSQAAAVPDAVEKESRELVPAAPNAKAMAIVCATVKQLQARGIHVVFTEPNAHLAPENLANYRAFMRQVAAQVEQCGATFVSVPSHGLLPFDAMLDTHLHPNQKGRALRTAELGPALCQAGLPCRSGTPAEAAADGD